VLHYSFKLEWDALCKILLHEAVFQFSVEYTCRKMITLLCSCTLGLLPQCAPLGSGVSL
jgi:hypothetical protein